MPTFFLVLSLPSFHAPAPFFISKVPGLPIVTLRLISQARMVVLSNMCSCQLSVAGSDVLLIQHFAH